MKYPTNIALNFIEELSVALNNNPDISFAYLFGSQAAGRTSKFSDIDVAVFLNSDPDGKKRLEILGDVIDAVKSNRVDLVILNSAPLPLKSRVIKTGQLLVDNDPFARHVFESNTVRSYIDFSRYEKAILRRRFYVG